MLSKECGIHENRNRVCRFSFRWSEGNEPRRDCRNRNGTTEKNPLLISRRGRHRSRYIDHCESKTRRGADSTWQSQGYILHPPRDERPVCTNDARSRPSADRDVGLRRPTRDDMAGDYRHEEIAGAAVDYLVCGRCPHLPGNIPLPGTLTSVIPESPTRGTSRESSPKTSYPTASAGDD